jgi:hypothetical protein
MGVLRGMVQMSPKIAFALAGLHTLEEMTEDYFNPFFCQYYSHSGFSFLVTGNLSLSSR